MSGKLICTNGIIVNIRILSSDTSDHSDFTRAQYLSMN